MLRKSHSGDKIHGSEQGWELCQHTLSRRSRLQLRAISGTLETSLHLGPYVSSKPLLDQNRDVSGNTLQPNVACPELPDQRA